MGFMFGRRRGEREPTVWYRLADSQELFAALHETTDGRPLLPMAGGMVSPLRRYVAMHPADRRAPALLEGSGAPGASHHQSQLTPWASFSSAETMMRPLVPSYPYGVGPDPHQLQGAQLPLPLQPQHPLHLQPPQWPQQPAQPQQLLQGQQVLHGRHHTQLPGHGARRHSHAAGPLSAPPVAPLAAAPRRAGLAPAPSGGPLASAYQPLEDSSFFQETSDPFAAVAPHWNTAPGYDGLTPATAVAAVAAVAFGNGSGIVQGVLEPVLGPTMGGDQVALPATAAPHAAAALMNVDEGQQRQQQHLRRPWPQEMGLLQQHQQQRQRQQQGLRRDSWPEALAAKGSYISAPARKDAIPPPDASSITTIQQWLLMVPDHSKLALAKAWSMSVQNATAQEFSPLSGLWSQQQQELRERRQQLEAATFWLPAGIVPAAVAVAQPPKSLQPAVMKAPTQHQVDSALTPELVLQYTNLLYGEQWDKPPQHSISATGQSVGQSALLDRVNQQSMARVTTADAPDSRTSSAVNGRDSKQRAALCSGTQRLYNMYNQVLGLAKPKAWSAASDARPAAGQELPPSMPPPSAQPLANMPYMPDLMEHISTAGLENNAASSMSLQQYVPKAAVWQAAWAAQRATSQRDGTVDAAESKAASEAAAKAAATTASPTSPSDALPAEAGPRQAAVPAEGHVNDAGAESSSTPQQSPGQWSSAVRWRDRKQMEAVLAPVFVVDLDSGQVAITYINGRGRSEVQTQTERRGIVKEAGATAAGDLDSASCGSKGSSDAAGSAGTDDMSSAASSHPADDYDTETASASSRAYSHEPPKNATQGSRLQQLLKRMNVFRHWRSAKSSHQARSSAGKPPPLQPTASADVAVTANDNTRSSMDGDDEDSASVLPADAADKDGGEGSSTIDDQPAPASTAAATAAGGPLPAKQKKLKRTPGSARHVGELAVKEGVAGTDQPQGRHTAAEALQSRQMKSKKRAKGAGKAQKDQDGKGSAGLGLKPALDTTDGVKPEAALLITRRRSDKKSQSKSKTAKSKPSSSRPHAVPAVQAPQNDDGTGLLGSDTAATADDEELEAVEEVYSKEAADRKPHAASSGSKKQMKDRRFIFRFWKRRQPKRAEESEAEATVTRESSGEQEATVGHFMNGSAGKASKLAADDVTTAGMRKGEGDGTTPPKKLDNQAQETMEPVKKDNTAALSKNAGDQGPGDEEVSDDGPVHAVGSTAVQAKSPATTSKGGKQWIQRFYASAADSVHSRFPKGKHDAVGKGAAAKGKMKREDKGAAHLKQPTATAATSAAFSPGSAAVGAAVQQGAASAVGISARATSTSSAGDQTPEDVVDGDEHKLKDEEVFGSMDVLPKQDGMPSGSAAAAKAAKQKQRKGQKHRAAAGTSSDGATESKGGEKAATGGTSGGLLARFKHKQQKSGKAPASPSSSDVNTESKPAKGKAKGGPLGGLFSKHKQEQHKGDEPPAGANSDGNTESKQAAAKRRPLLGGLLSKVLGRQQRSSSEGAANTTAQEIKTTTSIADSSATPANRRNDELVEIAGRSLDGTAATTTGVQQPPATSSGQQQPPVASNSTEVTNLQQVSPEGENNIATNWVDRAESAEVVATPGTSRAPALASAVSPSSEIQAAMEEGLEDDEAADNAGTAPNVNASNAQSADLSAASKGSKVKGKRKGHAGKKDTKKGGKSTSAAAAPSATLPPPKGPKAKLMQKLLKLSDVVNAQRAAAEIAERVGDAAPDAAGVRTATTNKTVAAAVEAAPGTTAIAADEAAEGSGLPWASPDAAKRHAGAAGTDDSISGSQQQQPPAAIAAGSEAAPHNKASALERLKNTLTRTRAKRRSSSSEQGAQPVQVSNKASSSAVEDRDNNADNISSRVADEDSQTSRSNSTLQAAPKDAVTWGTQRAQQESTAAGSEGSSSPSKPSVIGRMMMSLRRAKHQTTEVQEMVTFKEVKEPKGFGDESNNKAHQESAGATAGVARTAVEPVSANTSQRSGGGAAASSSAASSPQGDDATTRASRLSSMTRAAASPLSRPGPAGQQQQSRHEGEDLMASIRNRTSDKEQEPDHNATGRRSGSVPAQSGGWAVQQSGSGRRSGGGGGGGAGSSTPGSPLMQSLLKSTLNKTATIIRGQDATPSPGASPLASLREAIVEEDDEGEVGDNRQGSASGAAAMAKQLAELGLPPSKW